jgi:hypothetical protein
MKISDAVLDLVRRWYGANIARSLAEKQHLKDSMIIILIAVKGLWIMSYE